MATFKINKKHDFKFEFIVDGEKHIEKVSIDMTDKNIPVRLMNTQNLIDEKIKSIKMADVKLKSNGLPKKIESFEDAANLSGDQCDDIRNIANAVSDYQTKVENAIIEEMNEALNTDVSPAFKYCSALDVINGEYYCTLFIESLGKEMIKYMKAHPQQEINYNNKPYMKRYL